nr:YlbF family regulator [Bacilli bacterium]
MTLDRNQILFHANELGKLLANTEEVQHFKAAEDLLLAHEKASTLLQQLNQAEVDAQNEEIDPTDPEIATILDALDDIPEVVAFHDAQANVDHLLSTVSSMIADSMTSHAGLFRVEKR